MGAIREKELIAACSALRVRGRGGTSRLAAVFGRCMFMLGSQGK